MSSHVNNEVLLVGAGSMGVEYATVLQALNINVTVVGRSPSSVEKFSIKTGINAISGGLEDKIQQIKSSIQTAIVAVDVENLASTTKLLIHNGCKKILVEKPGGLNLNELVEVSNLSKEYHAEVFIAYNRRYYSSVQKAIELIKEDGGVKSFHFEFTEWSHKIIELNKSKEVLRNWFLGNSSHVVDVAFFLGGTPKDLSTYIAGGTDWHPSASIYAGAGQTIDGALFTYNANWEAPGRWGIEVLTSKHRYIFRPLEQLQIMRIGSTLIERYEIDDSHDDIYKPGLYKEVEAFLKGDDIHLCSLEENVLNTRNIYSKINQIR